MGQGSITIFTQLAAAALGVDAAQVSVVDPSTARVPDSGPTVASRTAMVVGGLVERAAKAVRQKLEAWGAQHASQHAMDLTGDPRPAGKAVGGPTPLGGSLVELARAYAEREQREIAETVTYEPPPGIQWDDATYTGSAYPVYGWAACLVDVEIDLDSYEVAITRCVQAVDVGKALNPAIVRGQIEGGTLQALGWAVLENVVYKEGKVANASMTNCIVPTFADAPELETILVEVPYPFGPGGAKGVGEIPMDGPAAAVANAVEDALGCAFDALPISPEAVARSRPRWEAS
jgi:CO/xanthine dehydrogenase Mo-binding subunit